MPKYLVFVALTVFLVFAIRYFYFRPILGYGEACPEFKCQNIQGKELSLSSFKGKYVVLDFWGGWCDPCRAENPILRMFYEQYKDAKFNSAEGIDFLSVALERNRDQAIAAIEKDGLIWPNQVIQEDRMNSDMAVKFGVKEIPSKFLISPEGKILLVNPDFKELDDYLAKNRLKN